MVSLGSLWLPILLSSLIVFVASSLVWMVLPHHKSDWAKIPNEGPLLQAIRSLGLGRGQYIFPAAMRSGAKDPDAPGQLAEGPVGLLIIRSGPPNMGKSLAFYFLFNLAVSFMVAYLASRTLAPGAEYLAVFRVVGTVAFLAYSAAEIPNAIWFGRTWSSTGKSVIDGLVYGLLTAGVFGWLWPS